MLIGTVRPVILRIKAIKLYRYWFSRLFLFLFLISFSIQFFSRSSLCILSNFLESSYGLLFVVANGVKKLGFYFIEWLFKVLFLCYFILIQSIILFTILLFWSWQKLLQLLLRTGFPIRASYSTGFLLG